VAVANRTAFELTASLFDRDDVRGACFGERKSTNWEEHTEFGVDDDDRNRSQDERPQAKSEISEKRGRDRKGGIDDNPIHEGNGVHIEANGVACVAQVRENPQSKGQNSRTVSHGAKGHLNFDERDQIL
jgi:hypothetical protein